ncbi:hypothetical protein TGAM01_v205114 [Trichoderma gamsii]|uniref:Uncharacterized protein n=1 Tax=Trichoderma gamsii TaxID=398673 RepID=A0A2P4ZPF1_9HYPO|nr:hypothetical protein TGAM01_v205114 [Trichoderma gamsii]PON26170.1 hypothetical protein TGAM01_v205114 [Trichoderma gamsii]
MTGLGANRARAPRAAVDGIDLVCPQVHCSVHMRDLPPPRETRSAAALIGREGYRPYYVGAGDSELRGIVTLTNRQNGESRWFIETSFNVPQDRQISPQLDGAQAASLLTHWPQVVSAYCCIAHTCS